MFCHADPKNSGNVFLSKFFAIFHVPFLLLVLSLLHMFAIKPVETFFSFCLHWQHISVPRLVDRATHTSKEGKVLKHVSLQWRLACSAASWKHNQKPLNCITEDINPSTRILIHHHRAHVASSGGCDVFSSLACIHQVALIERYPEREFNTRNSTTRSAHY